MSVHKKLNEARIELQSAELKKSGNNKFAGYKYFELGDFLPSINRIFNGLGLCGVVSYATDLATLTITDIEDGSQVQITSPMAEANLKGCHPIQNLGAVETYTRRYLWVTAMEIVEHDAIDASEGVKEKSVFPLEFHVEQLKSATTVEELQEFYMAAKESAVKANDASAVKAINALTSQLKSKLVGE